MFLLFLCPTSLTRATYLRPVDFSVPHDCSICSFAVCIYSYILIFLKFHLYLYFRAQGSSWYCWFIYATPSSGVFLVSYSFTLGSSLSFSVPFFLTSLPFCPCPQGLYRPFVFARAVELTGGVLRLDDWLFFCPIVTQTTVSTSDPC